MSGQEENLTKVLNTVLNDLRKWSPSKFKMKLKVTVSTGIWKPNAKKNQVS